MSKVKIQTPDGIREAELEEMPVDIESVMAELKRLYAGATKGEWYWRDDCLLTTGENYLVLKPYSDESSGYVSTVIFPGDRDFIAAAHNHLPALIAELKAYQQHGTADGYADALKSSLDNYNRAKEAERDVSAARAWCDELQKQGAKLLEECNFALEERDSLRADNDRLQKRAEAAEADMKTIVCLKPCVVCGNTDCTQRLDMPCTSDFEWRGPAEAGAEGGE